MAECIHGFDEGLCDVCSPRMPAGAAQPVRAARAPASRTASGDRGPRARPAQGSARASAPVPASTAPVRLEARRVYHVTHERNLEAIVVDGALRAHVVPEVDVSSPTTRELRAGVVLPTGDTVADRVPFAFSPHAARWEELRSGAAGAHWSAAARRLSPTEFVVLVAPAGALGADVVVADGDAAAPATRFAAGADAGGALLRRALAADPELAHAELLAPAEVPFAAIALLGVPNEKVRDRVRALLAEAGGAVPKIAVYPPWFQPAAA